MKKYYNVTKAVLFLMFVVVPMVVFKALLTILGYPLVAVGLLFAKGMPMIPYKGHSERVVDDSWKYVELRPKWIDNLWGSEKYGAEGNWFWNDNQNVTEFLPRWLWLANRNPVSNITKVFGYYVKKDVVNNNIEYIGSLDTMEAKPKGWNARLCWYDVDGFVAGFELVKHWGNGRYTKVKLGFKLRPQDKDKVVNAFTSLNVAPYKEYK